MIQLLTFLIRFDILVYKMHKKWDEVNYQIILSILKKAMKRKNKIDLINFHNFRLQGNL